MIWCMKRTNIYLGEEQTASLDKLARVFRVPSSSVNC